MAGVTYTDHDAVLKELYDKNKMESIGLAADPIISLIPHTNDWVGDSYWRIALQHGTNQSVSATFATAIGMNHHNIYKRFDLQPVEYFGEAHFTRMFLELAKGDGVAQQAYVDGLTAEIDGVLDTLAHEKAFQFYRSYGNRGQISLASNPGTPTITLTQPRDAVLFHVGMKLQVSDNIGSGGAARAGTVEVEAVDLDSGEITCTGNWTLGIGACIAGDYIFRSGDFGNGYISAARWIPTAAPTGVDIGGVDRSVDPVRLAGHRQSVGALSTSEALRKLAAKIATTGGKPDTAVLHVDRWTDLESELSTAGYRDFRETDAAFGFESIKMRTPSGTIKVYGSPFCSYTQGFVLSPKKWEFKSTKGGMPEIFMNDNQKILREASANEYTARLGWIANLGCRNPADNGVLVW
jgi:hypothetical protein